MSRPVVERVYAPDPERCARAVLVLLTKREAPLCQSGADVDSPQPQTEGADDMLSVAHVRPSMTAAPSDRALGAEAHPGLGDGRRRGEEGRWP